MNPVVCKGTCRVNWKPVITDRSGKIASGTRYWLEASVRPRSAATKSSDCTPLSAVQTNPHVWSMRIASATARKNPTAVLPSSEMPVRNPSMRVAVVGIELPFRPAMDSSRSNVCVDRSNRNGWRTGGVEVSEVAVFPLPPMILPSPEMAVGSPTNVVGDRVSPHVQRHCHSVETRRGAIIQMGSVRRFVAS